MNTQCLITEECDNIKKLLLEKNRKYGDSAINPARIFSKASPVEQILVRLDDKINRIKNAQNDEDEDVISDLIGYLILLKVAKRSINNGEVRTEQNEKMAQGSSKIKLGAGAEAYWSGTSPSYSPNAKNVPKFSKANDLNEGYNYAEFGDSYTGYRD